MHNTATPTCSGNKSRYTFLGILHKSLFSRYLARITLFAFLFQLIACNYYRTRTEDPSAIKNLYSLSKGKIFLLHQGSKTWSLTDPVLNGDELEGKLNDVPASLTNYAYTDPVKSHRYQSKDKYNALNLVHLYINEYRQEEGSQVAIPVSSIKRIDIVEKDTGRTIATHVLSTIGITVGVLLLISIIILLTKSSCPFVYTHNGEGYEFTGEAYGGAIFAPLERDDFMPLPNMVPVENEYRLRITNELKERQYTNLAELWVVQHPADSKVLLDNKGNVHTLSAIQAPVAAQTNAGESCLEPLLKQDKASHLFNEDVPENKPNEAILTFDKPSEAVNGKLVLHAQNSLWLDYLFGEFTQQFGSYYNKWAASQKRESYEKLSQWQHEQGIPLSVYLETNKGWQLVDHIESVGPLASRDLVVPVNLADVQAKDQIRIKLTSGFMFWEVDYVGIDYTANVPVKMEKYKPARAVNEKGQDVRQALSGNDEVYLHQLQPGTAVSISYRHVVQQAPGTTLSTFLHTKGYYEHVRDYTGTPDVPELISFRKPGRFIEFSKEKYQEVNKQMRLTATAR
jgi:hypothetical protein